MTLLDTNVFIHHLKGDSGFVARIMASSRGELAIPTIVIYELEYGTLGSRVPNRRRHSLEAGLRDMQQVPFDSAAAIAAATVRVALEKLGMTVEPLDILIAGTAVSRGAALVTNNAAEFARVPGLRVMDWKSG